MVPSYLTCLDLLNGLFGDILDHKECWTNDDRRGRTVIGVGDFRLNCVMILSIAGTMAPSYLIRLVSSLGDILHFVQRVVFHEKGILSCLGRQGDSNGVGFILEVDEEINAVNSTAVSACVFCGEESIWIRTMRGGNLVSGTHQ